MKKMLLILLVSGVAWADSYKMAGMALPPHPGNMYLSNDQGRTWQRYGTVARANYAIALSKDGTLWHRTGNDEIAGCETDGKTNCSIPNKGARCRELVADNFGYLYHLDLDTQRIWISTKADNGHSGTWQEFGKLEKGIIKIAPASDQPRKLFVLQDTGKIIVLEDGKIQSAFTSTANWNLSPEQIEKQREKGVPKDVPIGIAHAPDGRLWYLFYGKRWPFYAYTGTNNWATASMTAIYEPSYSVGDIVIDMAIAPDGVLFLIIQTPCSKGPSPLCYQLLASNNFGHSWERVAANVPFQRLTMQPQPPGTQPKKMRRCHSVKVSQHRFYSSKMPSVCKPGYEEVTKSIAHYADPEKPFGFASVNTKLTYCCSTKDVGLQKNDFNLPYGE